ncbi:nuclear transport factor 2 family protein [Sphingomonas sp. VDB2]|uniref:nuclear transport factor 2 family protein n=1 Tax=Sphingomonas sp. VDB2 TaxID=3228751 RepID=UPI003A7FBFDF
MSQSLIDQLALRDLLMRYCRGCDRRDFMLVRSLYHDDAIDDHGAMFRGGPDDFVAWLPQAMAPWQATRHSIANSLFVVDGDRAEGEHHVEAWHRSHGPEPRDYIVYGRYLDRYERRDGVWKFSHRSLVFDHGLIRDADQAAMDQLGADAPHGRADREDPSWAYALLAGAAR